MAFFSPPPRMDSWITTQSLKTFGFAVFPINRLIVSAFVYGSKSTVTGILYVLLYCTLNKVIEFCTFLSACFCLLVFLHTS